MSHLPLMEWDYRDQLQATAQLVVNNGTPETTWYVYDSAGQRVRKVTDNSAAAGLTPARKAERLYLGCFEIHLEYGSNGSAVTLERETLHVMDDKQRIVLVETRTQGNDPSIPQLIRFQYGNHLGSASLELDDQAQIISYEEYFPYGNTSYQAVRNRTETPKRYRYTGKERDEESGFCYHGARHYLPWLGRWPTCDPAGFVDGTCLYEYCRSDPIGYLDSNGLGSDDEKHTIKKGDTYSSLAKSSEGKYSVNDLKKWNPGVDWNKLQIGSQINIGPAQSDYTYSFDEIAVKNVSQPQPVKTPGVTVGPSVGSGSGVGTLPTFPTLDNIISTADMVITSADIVAEQTAKKYVIASNNQFYLKELPGKRGFRGNQHRTITDDLGKLSSSIGKISTGVDRLGLVKSAYDVFAAETKKEARDATATFLVEFALTRVNPVVSLTIGFGQIIEGTDRHAKDMIRHYDKKLAEPHDLRDEIRLQRFRQKYVARLYPNGEPGEKEGKQFFSQGRRTR
jgi:RHS repeat-associated protein